MVRQYHTTRFDCVVAGGSRNLGGNKFSLADETDVGQEFLIEEGKLWQYSRKMGTWWCIWAFPDLPQLCGEVSKTMPGFIGQRCNVI